MSGTYGSCAAELVPALPAAVEPCLLVPANTLLSSRPRVLTPDQTLGVGRPADSGGRAPNSDAILSWAPRHTDWTITVPLLIIELIAVSVLAGAVARRVRFIGIAAAFGMIFTGSRRTRAGP